MICQINVELNRFAERKRELDPSGLGRSPAFGKRKKKHSLNLYSKLGSYEKYETKTEIHR